MWWRMGCQIVLSAKPHQKHVMDIKYFVWVLCVSYRRLNSVTNPFDYPIPHCDSTVTIFQIGSKTMCIITVDAKQGFHQTKVRVFDVDKLDFFEPDDKKYTFTVIPFGTIKTPVFYTCMMGNLNLNGINYSLKSCVI